MTRLSLPVSRHDHAHGRLTADVVLVEYGDYTSRRCRAAHEMTEEIVRWLGTKQFCFVFRHFTTACLERNARRAEAAKMAAMAAEAAGAQGRFWEMHAALCRFGRGAMDEATLLRCAARAALNIEQFKRDMKEECCRTRVLKNYRSGRESFVTSVPAFFINDELYRGAADLDALLYAIALAGDPTIRQYRNTKKLTGIITERDFFDTEGV